VDCVTAQEKILCSGGLWGEEGWDEDVLKVLGGGVGGRGVEVMMKALDMGRNVLPAQVLGKVGRYWKERWGFGEVDILTCKCYFLLRSLFTVYYSTKSFLSVRIPNTLQSVPCRTYQIDS